LVEAQWVPIAIGILIVSIPERVLGWLKPRRAIGLWVAFPVSIPERVLGWLKHGTFVGYGKAYSVSIPERVLGWLKPRSKQKA